MTNTCSIIPAPWLCALQAGTAGPRRKRVKGQCHPGRGGWFNSDRHGNLWDLGRHWYVANQEQVVFSGSVLSQLTHPYQWPERDRSLWRLKQALCDIEGNIRNACKVSGAVGWLFLCKSPHWDIQIHELQDKTWEWEHLTFLKEIQRNQLTTSEMPDSSREEEEAGPSLQAHPVVTQKMKQQPMDPEDQAAGCPRCQSWLQIAYTPKQNWRTWVKVMSETRSVFCVHGT